MPSAPLHANEAERLAALRSYEVLGTGSVEALDSIVGLAAKLSACPIALVSLVDEEQQCFPARRGLQASETHRDLAFCAHAILHPMDPMVVRDATRDPRFANNALVTGEPGIRFYAGVPLVNPQGYALGTLCVIDLVPRDITEDELDTLVRLADTVMTTLELRRAMRQMHHLATTASLTGVANRPAFLNALDCAIAQLRWQGEPFTLFYFDLDGFKKVNDVQGHLVGDQVLREVATILRTNLRRPDLAARLGGDEFAVLLHDSGDGVVAAERIRAEVRAGMHAAGWQVAASVGAVRFQAAPRDVGEALAAADDLLYQAKSGGKDRVAYRVYTQASAIAA